MKSALDKSTSEQAQKELPIFTIIGLVAGIIGVALLSWVGIVALALGARETLMSYHTGNKSRKNILAWRTLALITLLLGVFSLLLPLLNN